MQQRHTVAVYDTAQGTSVLVFHVFAEKSGAHLDRQARLELTNLTKHSGVYQTIEGEQDGVFRDITYGRYDVEVIAVGYLTAHQEVQVGSLGIIENNIVLQRDPSAVRLADVAGVMPRKARKEAKKAVSLLKSGSFPAAQKHLEAAYQLAPSNSDLNFLLGYLYFQKKDYAQARTYLDKAASLSPNSAQTLTLLGRASLAQENYPDARTALEQAVLIDGENWQPHHLLADAYLREKAYDKARNEAEKAIAKAQKSGKTFAAPSEIVLGQALIGLGRDQEAIHALELFEKDSPQNPAVSQVRALITEVQKRSLSAPGNSSGKDRYIDTSRVDSLRAVPDPVLSTKIWRPADVDDVKPTLVPGITCSAPQVMAESGKKMQELVDDLARFAADEDLFHQSMDAFGLAIDPETRKYEYFATVSSGAGATAIEEYRVDKIVQKGSPGGIKSTGFMALALVFHPDRQDDFQFVCEGQGDWRGQASWLVHFRQRPDRPNHMHAYNIDDQAFPVALKGRAWITTDRFQIVRIEADIVKPMAEIQLLSEHQTVEYGPVPFAKKNTVLWLPKNAEIYIDFRKRHFYRRHSFDHYTLFSVDAEEKPKVPASAPPKEISE